MIFVGGQVLKDECLESCCVSDEIGMDVHLYSGMRATNTSKKYRIALCFWIRQCYVLHTEWRRAASATTVQKAPKFWLKKAVGHEFSRAVDVIPSPAMPNPSGEVWKPCNVHPASPYFTLHLEPTFRFP